jgi:hypothetical protein
MKNTRIVSEVFMKRLYLAVLVLVFVFPLFSHDPNPQIADYFPHGIGNIWTYANTFDKITDVIIMKGSTPDNIANDGTYLYMFEWQMVGIGTSSTLYSIKQNRVVIMVEGNTLGQYQEKKPPHPILSPTGQEWRYKDRGDDLRYKTSNSSCAFDGKIFDNCILVEEQIFADQVFQYTKKSYYAKGVGLVYVTIQEPGKEERCFQKLIECNFFDITNAAINDEKIHRTREAEVDVAETDETEIILQEVKIKEEIIAEDALSSSETTPFAFIGYIFNPELPIGFSFWFNSDRFGFYFSIGGSRLAHMDWPTIDEPSNPLDTQEEHFMDVMFGLSYRIINNFFINVGVGPLYEHNIRTF